MDFLELREKAKKLKSSAVKASRWAIEYSASKLADSSFTLTSVEQLNDFLKYSLKTQWIDSSTWAKKEFPKRVIIIFTDTKSDFFKSMLYSLPVLSAKVFSQNLKIRLADRSMKKLDRKKYNVSQQDTLLLIENMEIIKSISWAENIQKIVKDMSLDINKSIEELD